MGIKALQVGQVLTHVSKHDVRPPEGDEGHESYIPTTWRYRVLDSRLLGMLKDKATKISIDPTNPDGEIGTEVSQNAYYFNVCSFGLDKPDDFYEDDGSTKVVWRTEKRNFGGKSYEVVSNDTLGKIPDFVIQELAEKIISGNTVTADEGKPSASQS